MGHVIQGHILLLHTLIHECEMWEDCDLSCLLLIGYSLPQEQRLSIENSKFYILLSHLEI